MLNRFIATPFGREVATNCAQTYLAGPPASVKLVIMFETGSRLKYVGEAFKLFSTVRPRPWHWLNKVAYTDVPCRGGEKFSLIDIFFVALRV